MIEILKEQYLYCCTILASDEKGVPGETFRRSFWVSVPSRTPPYTRVRSCCPGSLSWSTLGCKRGDCGDGQPLGRSGRDTEQRIFYRPPHEKPPQRWWATPRMASGTVRTANRAGARAGKAQKQDRIPWRALFSLCPHAFGPEARKGPWDICRVCGNVDTDARLPRTPRPVGAGRARRRAMPAARGRGEPRGDMRTLR